MSDGSMLILRQGDAELLLCPQIGASIARLTWRGRDILRPIPDAAIGEGNVRRMGAFPLLPYSNRIGHGRLLVNGVTFPLRANFAPEPHTVHGFGWQRVWQIAESDAVSARLTLQHTPDDDWPFACEGAQSVSLLNDAVTINLSLTNRDHRRMPAGLGFHPYFPLTDQLTLQSEWQSMWRMNEESLPVGTEKPPAEADFARARAVAGWRIDNCFSGWNRTALLDYQTHSVKIHASDNCNHVICYIPPDGRKLIAVEPVTHVNNALQLRAAGEKSVDMHWLAPGETMEIAMTLTMRESGAHA